MLKNHLPIEIKNYLIKYHSKDIKRFRHNKVIFYSFSRLAEIITEVDNMVYQGKYNLKNNYYWETSEFINPTLIFKDFKYYTQD